MWRDFVRNIPGAVWTWSRTAGFTVLTDHIERITGFTAGDFHAGGIEFWAARVHPADIGALLERWGKLFETRESSFESEYRFLRKDGTWAWLHERTSVATTATDAYVIGATSDITARRLAEDALRKSELRYRMLFESARDIIFSIDVRGRIASLNPAFETLTGWSCEEWIGRNFTQALEAPSAFAALKHGKDAPAYREYRMRTRSGRPITVEAIAHAIELDGESLGMIGIARDVTRRKEIEAQVAQEKRLASVGQLATSVAHEFNNVLMSILPFAELIARRVPGDERVVAAARHITDAVRRGREISEDVLRAARPAKPAIAPLNISEWLDDFAARAAVLLGPAHRVERGAVDRDLVVAADRGLLDQVASNLVVNAREAMTGSGTLTISVNDLDDAIEIEFHDTGRGMDEETLDHIFQPLFTTKRGRAGVGLSVAHLAMKQQDGSIRVRSRLGEGSTFTLSFKRRTIIRPEADDGDKDTRRAAHVRRVQ